MSTTIHVGNALDVLAGLPSESVHCCVTSPPYWGLRSYNGDTWECGDPSCDHKRSSGAVDTSTLTGGKKTVNHSQEGWPCNRCGKCGARLTGSMIGLEASFDEHLSNLVAVFREVRRVLRNDGTLWLNYGDAYVAGQGGRQSAVGEMPKKVIQKRATPRKRDDVDVGSWSNRDATDKMTAPSDIWKPKDLMMMPARVAMALQADGWWLRSEIIWHKPNPMPESCTDRPTSAHEKLFLLTKSARYFYDAEAVRVPHKEPWRGVSHHESDKPHSNEGDGQRWVPAKREYNPAGANLRNVWKIPTHSFKEAHFATFPPKLVEPCIKAGTSERGVCVECGAPWKRQVESTKAVPTPHIKGLTKEIKERNDCERGYDFYPKTKTTGWVPTCEHKDATVPATVLDPFAGSGTVGLVADRLQRDSVLIELSPEYAEMAGRRIKADAPLLADVVAAGDTL